jgi:hypothetical protein
MKESAFENAILPKEELWKLTGPVDRCRAFEINGPIMMPSFHVANSIQYSADTPTRMTSSHNYDNWLSEVTSEMEITLDYNEGDPHLCSPPVANRRAMTMTMAVVTKNYLTRMLRCMVPLDENITPHKSGIRRISA